jgi:molybdopterin molybdotransferase/putative molybdopterin biosynthesis protein
MQTRVKNQLATIRRGRGVGASELAKRVGVSRQTIYAIEAGDYVPNTEVTLRLARELEVPVEELFSLIEEKQEARRTIPSEVLSNVPLSPGQAVRVCQIEGRIVSIPVNAEPYFLPEADGVISHIGRSQQGAELVVFSRENVFGKRLIVAGCDPAMSLVSRMVEKMSGVEIVSAAASSKLALTWLKEQKVHIAGCHLQDPETGEFNLPFIRRELAGDDFIVVTFAGWEQGFVTATGNPKKIKRASDVVKRTVRLMNRESGSGSRTLLDRLLGEAGIPGQKVAGYDRIAFGHLSAAYAVKTAQADCCVATRSAAQVYGLGFIPLQSERYDFVMRRQTLETPAAQTFLDVLQRASLRRKLEFLAGYDTEHTGTLLT